MPIPGVVTELNKRYLNRLTLLVVGHLGIVELEHVGRRSGTVYRTPLMAFRHGDEVTVALTYGPNVEWLKNLIAAGGGRMRFGDEWVLLGAPQFLDPDVGLSRVAEPQRTILRWVIRCEDFVAMPIGSEENPPGAL